MRQRRQSEKVNFYIKSRKIKVREWEKMILEKIITFYYQERNPMLKKSNPSRICTKKKKISVTLIVVKLNNMKENKNQNKQTNKSKQTGENKRILNAPSKKR